MKCCLNYYWLKNLNGNPTQISLHTSTYVQKEKILQSTISRKNGTLDTNSIVHTMKKLRFKDCNISGKIYLHLLTKRRRFHMVHRKDAYRNHHIL